ncbi:hypothetical protein EIP93_21510 [Pectobacterium versatile]|nr:hypothetical protein EIP93_21510 [Pectobacterium versatile]TAI86121.1 hypothetical protein EG330_07570 [Pectobacterium versatile]TAJ01170.1 hypothetical protein EG335_02270 [Pectobacterium versatile]
MLLTVFIYTRHTSNCLCVGFPYSPQSLTCVSSWGLVRLPPPCNSNYLGYLPGIIHIAGVMDR